MTCVEKGGSERGFVALGAGPGVAHRLLLRTASAAVAPTLALVGRPLVATTGAALLLGTTPVAAATAAATRAGDLRGRELQGGTDLVDIGLEHRAALALAGRLLDSNRQVAGICGATRALARAGLLEHRAHVVDADADEPDYPGRSARVHASIAHDGPLITAIGEAPLEFSRAVFMALDLDDQAGIDTWYASFKGVPDAR